MSDRIDFTIKDKEGKEHKYYTFLSQHTSFDDVEDAALEELDRPILLLPRVTKDEKDK